MVKFKHLTSKETESNKCYVKYFMWKVFSKFYKTIKKSTSSNIADLFSMEEDSKGTRMAIQEHSKDTPRALGH